MTETTNVAAIDAGIAAIKGLKKRDADTTEDAVAAAKRELQPTVETARALLKDVATLQREHGERLERVAEIDWTELRRHRIPEHYISELHRLVRSTRDLMAATMSNMAAIPTRAERLDADALRLAVFEPRPWAPRSGWRAIGPEYIRVEVLNYTGTADTIRERIARIGHLLAEIQQRLESDGVSEPLPTFELKRPEDEREDAKRQPRAAETAFDPFEA